MTTLGLCYTVFRENVRGTQSEVNKRNFQVRRCLNRSLEREEGPGKREKNKADLKADQRRENEGITLSSFANVNAILSYIEAKALLRVTVRLLQPGQSRRQLKTKDSKVFL